MPFNFRDLNVDDVFGPTQNFSNQELLEAALTQLLRNSFRLSCTLAVKEYPLGWGVLVKLNQPGLTLDDKVMTRMKPIFKLFRADKVEMELIKGVYAIKAY